MIMHPFILRYIKLHYVHSVPAILGTFCLVRGIRARRTEKGGRKAAPDRPVGAGEGKKKWVHVPSC